MNRLNSVVSLAKLAIALNKPTHLNRQLQRALRIAQSTQVDIRPAKNDLDDNLHDSSQRIPAHTQHRDAFSYLKTLLDLLNNAPSEIRNAPETTTLAQKIFTLMTDHADSDTSIA